MACEPAAPGRAPRRASGARVDLADARDPLVGVDADDEVVLAAVGDPLVHDGLPQDDRFDIGDLHGSYDHKAAIVDHLTIRLASRPPDGATAAPDDLRGQQVVERLAPPDHLAGVAVDEHRSPGAGSRLNWFESTSA